MLSLVVGVDVVIFVLCSICVARGSSLTFRIGVAQESVVGLFVCSFCCRSITAIDGDVMVVVGEGVTEVESLAFGASWESSLFCVVSPRIASLLFCVVSLEFLEIGVGGGFRGGVIGGIVRLASGTLGSS